MTTPLPHGLPPEARVYLVAQIKPFDMRLYRTRSRVEAEAVRQAWERGDYAFESGTHRELPGSALFELQR